MYFCIYIHLGLTGNAVDSSHFCSFYFFDQKGLFLTVYDRISLLLTVEQLYLCSMLYFLGIKLWLFCCLFCSESIWCCYIFLDGLIVSRVIFDVLDLYGSGSRYFDYFGCRYVTDITSNHMSRPISYLTVCPYDYDFCFLFFMCYRSMVMVFSSPFCL